MLTPHKLVLTATLAAVSLLTACNQEQPPTYDQNAQAIDPALKLYAAQEAPQDEKPLEPAPTAGLMTPAEFVGQPPIDPSHDDDTRPEATPMPEETNETPTIARTTDPEAMVNADKVELTEDQWRSILSDQEFDILRQHGTERAFTGRLLNETDPGSYHCAGCGLYLYDAKHKFHSGCGWPSFNQEVAQGALTYYVDKKFGMVRTEMRCARCDGHLGHVFDDAPDQPTGLRHCVNGGALIFVPQGADIAQTIREHRAQYADR